MKRRANTPPKILWVDDNADRRAAAKKMKRTLGSIQAWHPADLQERTDNFASLATFLAQERFDLVVLDFDLSGEPNTDGQLFTGRAPRFVGNIKDAATQHPQLLAVPIYLVSGHFFIENLDWHYVDLPSFDGILTEDDLEDRGFFKRLSSDALEYRRLRDAVAATARLPRVDLQLALELAKPPPIAVTAFTEATSWFHTRPTLAPRASETMWNLSQSFSTVEFRSLAPPLEFVRWLRFGLLRIPGPLLDGRRAAAALGMTTKAFEKRASYFADALYRGMFCDTAGSVPLWWQASLEQIVSDRASPEAFAPTLSALARIALRLKDDEVLWCAVAAARGEKLEAEVLAYPKGINYLDASSESLMRPVARANASPDVSVDLPSPFQRIYTFDPEFLPGKG